MPSVESNWTMCSFRHDPASGNRCAVGQEGQSSSLAPKAKAHTDGKIPSSQSSERFEERAHQEQGAEFRAEISFCEIIFGTLPSLNYKSESGCKHCDKCRYRHVEINVQPRKKVEEKWCERFSALMILIRENRFHREGRKNGTKSRRQILQRARCTTSKFGKERVHREEPFGSVNLMRAIRAPPKFEERTQDETLHQEGCARRVASDLAKSDRLKNTDKSCVSLSY